MSENLNSQQSFEEEAEILEGICEHYTLMCLLDTKSRMVHAIKSTELPQEIVTMINSASYQDSMSWLAKQYVYPNDIGRLLQVSSLETVLERLEKSELISCLDDDEKRMFIRMDRVMPTRSLILGRICSVRISLSSWRSF